MLSKLHSDGLASVAQLAAHDPSPFVAMEAIAALGNIGDIQALKQLESEIGEDPETRAFLKEEIENPRHAETRQLALAARALASRAAGSSYRGFVDSYPRMPWPPGQFTDRLIFEKSELGEFRSTLGDYHDRVKQALKNANYPEPSLYAIPGGFAMAAVPERFLDDGSAAGGTNRWTDGKLPLRSGNFVEYLRYLFLGATGHFRWFVFYATQSDFGNASAGPSVEEVRRWANGGFSDLPSTVAIQRTSGYTCGVLLFEFTLEDGSGKAEPSKSPSRNATQHLIGARIYESLFPTALAMGRTDLR